MKKITYTFLLVSFALFTGCGDKSNPFRDKSDAIQNAEVEPTAEKPVPGINPNAIQISLERDLSQIFFEVDNEKSYTLIVRNYLKNVDFSTSLEDAPDGMVLKLLNTINNEVITKPIDPNAVIDPNAPPVEGEAVKPNRKTYSITWKPTKENIPLIQEEDGIYPDFFKVKVSLEKDKVAFEEIRYVLTQRPSKLAIAGYEGPADIFEDDRKEIKVYVKYPGFTGTAYPEVFFKNTSRRVRGCGNIPNWMILNRVNYIDQPGNPNHEKIEYIYSLDLTGIEVTSTQQNCEFAVFVSNSAGVSAPFPAEILVNNLMTEPDTDWATNEIPVRAQGSNQEFNFKVFGKKNEGEVIVNFTNSCRQVFNNQGDCSCKYRSSFSDRHVMDCKITVNHDKTIFAKTYNLEFQAQMIAKGGVSSSKRITFKRRIKFSPRGLNLADGEEEFFDEAAESIPGDSILPPDITR